MIKIINSSYTDDKSLEYWYKDMIGKEFEIYYETHGHYWVRYNDNKCMNMINKEDVKLV